MKKRDENEKVEMLEGAKSIGVRAATIASAGAAVGIGNDPLGWMSGATFSLASILVVKRLATFVSLDRSFAYGGSLTLLLFNFIDLKEVTGTTPFYFIFFIVGWGRTKLDCLWAAKPTGEESFPSLQSWYCCHVVTFQ
ncbi:hypothetical protein RND81_12G065000 [Saponaria officinalis]|uniref:Uncharacterized protein n=1 Tax=Saponaria officinalis TaxID=3572 RepID=A0AAW1H6M3_SAPOF